MNCPEFRRELDEYLEGALDHSAHAAAAAHLHDCGACQRHVARLQSLRAALRRLPAPDPRPGFFAQALERTPERPVAASRRWPALAGLALAASLALWLGFGWLPNALHGPSEQAPEINIVLHEARTVQLAFHAERALDRATLRIRLPQGVELQGFPGQREVEWQTDLARGVNVLPLPLLAVSPGRGVLTAQLQHGDRRRELAIPLHVSGTAATGARLETCAPAAGCRPSSKEEPHAHT